MTKRIALIAHDNMKPTMVEWCKQNKEILSRHFLCGTGTTAGKINEATGLPVKAYLSGPLGGDQQIGAMLANGELGLIIFLRDPLTAQPHEPDVSALLRLCDVQKIPLATNVSSATVMLEALKNGTFFLHRN
jgi:methylglyoxal synthase